MASEGNSPEEFIFSKNFHRRHLTADQRIALVHRWAAATAKKAAKERQQLGAKFAVELRSSTALKSREASG